MRRRQGGERRQGNTFKAFRQRRISSRSTLLAIAGDAKYSADKPITASALLAAASFFQDCGGGAPNGTQLSGFVLMLLRRRGDLFSFPAPANSGVCKGVAAFSPNLIEQRTAVSGRTTRRDLRCDR